MNQLKKYCGIPLLAALWLVASFPCHASESSSDYISLLRNRRSANESLLKRFKSQANLLQKDLESNPSQEGKLRLSDIEYKMQTIEENNRRLEASIANHENANTFLKEFIAKKIITSGSGDNTQTSTTATPVTEESAPAEIPTPPSPSAPSVETPERVPLTEAHEQAQEIKPRETPTHSPPSISPRQNVEIPWETPSSASQSKVSLEIRKKNRDFFKRKRTHDNKPKPAREPLGPVEQMLPSPAPTPSPIVSAPEKIEPPIIVTAPSPTVKPEVSAEIRKKNRALHKRKKMHEKGLKLVAENKIREAKKLYENIIFINPGDDQAYIILGHIYILEGEYDKAEYAFSNAVDINPANIHDITPFYENMILKNPDDDMAHTCLGYTYLILGNFLKARECFERALDINAANKEAAQGYEITQR